MLSKVFVQHSALSAMSKSAVPKEENCTVTAETQMCHDMSAFEHCRRAGWQLAYPLILVAMELDHTQNGAPLSELVHPVVQGGLGHNDHVRARDASELMQVPQQRDCLQGLAQALYRQVALVRQVDSSL